MKTNRSYIALLAMILMFASTTQGLKASDSAADDQGNRCEHHPAHAVPATELHKLIQDSQKQVSESRKNVQEFLTRPDIKAEINHAGGNPEKVKFQVSLLSDEEVINLNRQVMDLDLQKETAGGAARTLLGLILLALSIYLLVNKFS